MVQTRWVLLELSMDDGEAETAELVDGSVEEYITKEIDWLLNSFSDVQILKISDENEDGFMMEEDDE